MTDSSYGSVIDLNEDKQINATQSHSTAQTIGSVHKQRKTDTQSSPQYFASLLATSALQLMSASTQIIIPRSENQQLQLRIALHSGPCSAGIIGLQTAACVSRIPHYKLFGHSLKYTHNLCTTGLALQIRVSKQCILRDVQIIPCGLLRN